MNNAFIALENVSLEMETPIDISKFREKETELITIIQAVEVIADSVEWQVLKEKVFDGVVDSLKRQREIEIEKKPLNGPVIHSLNGQLAWAKRYSNFATLADIYKQELANIRKQINAA